MRMRENTVENGIRALQRRHLTDSIRGLVQWEKCFLQNKANLVLIGPLGFPSHSARLIAAPTNLLCRSTVGILRLSAERGSCILKPAIP